MDYSNLIGEIRKKYKTQADFAKDLGVHPASLSLKLNGKSEWKTGEIVRTCELLDIPLEDASDYFFCRAY